MRFSRQLIAIVTATLVSLPLGAQVHSPAAFDITVGSHTVKGGLIDCAGQGNFVIVNALVGVDKALGAGSGRLLIGPAVYDGADAHSVGVQGRVDLTSPARAHLAFGLMGRATVLPSHNGQSLVAWATGVSLAFR